MDRTFKAISRSGREEEFELLEPTVALEQESEMERLKAYSAALKEGILPREKMKGILRDHGVYGDNEAETLSVHVREVANLERRLKDESAKGNNAECTNIAGKLSRQRLMMFRTFMIQQTVLTNSCEGFAELVKLESLMASSVVNKKTRERYWETYKDYVLERDFNGESTVVSEAQLLQTAIEEEKHNDLLSEYPEQKWLKDLNAKLTAQMESELERARQELTGKLEAAVVRERENADEVRTEVHQSANEQREDERSPKMEEVGEAPGGVDPEGSVEGDGVRG